MFSRSPPADPFPDVARAAAQLHPFRFAAGQETDDRNIDQLHFVEVQHDVWPVSRQAGPQFAHMLGVDPPADLFYRHNVFTTAGRPLRERVTDVPVLVEYLVERFAKRAGKKITRIEKRTMALLQAYDWPGNVRELQNVIERAVVLCERETFSIDDSWLKAKRPPAGGEQERTTIEAALAATNGRVAGPKGAAAKLGMPRQTLDSKNRP